MSGLGSAHTGRAVLRQTQYDYLYVFAAVCPQTGDACGLISPDVNTGVMNAFLEAVLPRASRRCARGDGADRAGWHTARGLCVPGNITLIHLPPKSPELNPVENLWHYLRSHHWSNRVYETWDDLKEAAIDAWRHVWFLNPELIMSVYASRYG